MRRALRAAPPLPATPPLPAAPPLPEPAVEAAGVEAAGAAGVAGAEGAAALGSSAPRGGGGCGGGGDAAPSAALDGWSVWDGDCVRARLRALCGLARHGRPAGDGGGVGGAGDGGRGEAGDEAGVPPPPPLPPLPLLQLHESGAPLQSALQGAAGAGASRGCVLLFGDHVGYTPDEEAAVLAAGGVCCALGRVPLLTSQCMVIAHFLLDAANADETCER